MAHSKVPPRTHATRAHRTATSRVLAAFSLASVAALSPRLAHACRVTESPSSPEAPLLLDVATGLAEAEREQLTRG